MDRWNEPLPDGGALCDRAGPFSLAMRTFDLAGKQTRSRPISADEHGWAPGDAVVLDADADLQEWRGRSSVRGTGQRRQQPSKGRHQQLYEAVQNGLLELAQVAPPSLAAPAGAREKGSRVVPGV